MEQQVIPNGYKRTELGVIPSQWDIIALGDISVISRLAGAEYTSFWEEVPNGEIIALRGFNIGKNEIIPKKLTRISNSLSLKLKRSRLTKGDIIYPCVGSVGNATVIDEDNKYHIQQNIARITPLNSKVFPYYLSHYLMSFFGLSEIDRFVATTSQPSVLVSSLRQYRIILPSIEEQTAIANALSDVDALIASIEKVIAKKQAIKTASMQQLLTGKKRLPPFDRFQTNEQDGIRKGQPKGTKQTELGEIPEDWDFDNIDNVLSITTGGRNTQDKIADGKYPFYVRSQTIERIHTYSFDGEGVLTAGDGVGTGKIFHYINGKCDIHQRVYLMHKFSKRLHGYYFYIYFKNNFYDKVMSMTAKSSVDSVRREMIADMPIVLPSIEEQKLISSVLSDMESELDTLEERLAKTQQIKQGMMQELLTGKTRLI